MARPAAEQGEGGKTHKRSFCGLQSRFPGIIGDVDGLGMALRIEVCKEDGVTPDRDLTDRTFGEGLKGDLEIAGRKYGLVLDVGGYYKNAFTLVPSFTISREETDLALELLTQLFRRCRQQARKRG
jgi:4-aminobutyrate aminotransferase-like enzyme